MTLCQIQSNTVRVIIILLVLMTVHGQQENVALAGPDGPGGDVETVSNPGEPSQGILTITCQEMWRAGGEEDEIFFGNIAQVLSDDDGNLYLLDSQLSEVHVYSSDGEHLRVLGREGEGPGEARSPGDMVFLPDGSLGLVQSFPGKVVKLNLDGTPAGLMKFNAGSPQQGNFAVLVNGYSRGGNVILAGIRMRFGGGPLSEQTYFLASCTEDGNEGVRYLSKENPLDYSNLQMDELGMDFVWTGRAALGSDGRVYTAPERNNYAIHVYRPDGVLERIITRDYKSLPRSEEQKRLARLTMEAIGANYPAPVQGVTVQNEQADIAALRVDESGRIFVQTSQGNDVSEEGVFHVQDVFDADGNFTHQIRVLCPGDALHDAIYTVDSKRAVVITGALDAYLSQQGVATNTDGEDEDYSMQIIVYELEGEF